jgi:hypothetical protein
MSAPAYDYDDCYPEYFEDEASVFEKDFEPEPACGCDGPHCLNCGCCEHDPCEGGCVWATGNLCSRCV